MSVCGIYAIENRISGRFYVGSSRNCARRFSEHRSRLRRGVHCNARLQASWAKHGEAAFVFGLLAFVPNPNDLESVEQSVIDEREAVAVGYNIAPTAGNTAGWRASDRTRARMSLAAKRRDHSVQVAAMAEATRGKKRPAYVIEAMQRGRRETPLTEASRAQMAASAQARSRYDDDARRRMAEMRDAGATWRRIAAEFGVTGHAAVMVYVKRWKADHA